MLPFYLGNGGKEEQTSCYQSFTWTRVTTINKFPVLVRQNKSIGRETVNYFYCFKINSHFLLKVQSGRGKRGGGRRERGKERR